MWNMQKVLSFINFSFFFFSFFLESYPTKQGSHGLRKHFFLTRVFRDNVCGTFKGYIIPSSFPQSLRNKDIISCCGKNYSSEYRFHLYIVSNVAPVIKHPVRFLSVPKYRIFFLWFDSRVQIFICVV